MGLQNVQMHHVFFASVVLISICFTQYSWQQVKFSTESYDVKCISCGVVLRIAVVIRKAASHGGIVHIDGVQSHETMGDFL